MIDPAPADTVTQALSGTRVKEDSYGDIKKGDAVRFGEERSAYRFVSFNRTPDGNEFLEIFGGRKGKEKLRCVAPSEVRLAKKPTRRRAA